MRVLVIGADGQVGHELCAILRAHDVIAPPRTALDLNDLAGLAPALAAARPQIVVNAAAWNDVDGAEKDPEGALRINRDAVAELGLLAEKHQAALIHYSTDFVFDGAKSAPYVEDDAPNPLNAYGRSKLAGEQALRDLATPTIVLRTAWVYSLRRKSFVSTLLKLARERPEIHVVEDQIGNPTYCRDLAVATAALIDLLGSDPFTSAAKLRGVYHLAGTNSSSRFEFARAILELDPFREEHVVRALIPVASSEYPTPAKRPTRAVLDCSKAARSLTLQLPDWRDALARALSS